MSFGDLIKGFKRFQTEYFGQGVTFYDELINGGQSPETLVIACSDSRNDPALLMQSKPGDIFVIRNVAALVPPYQPDGHYHGTSAGIEFAVKGLKVKNIVVLGHALCGGMNTLAQQGKNKTSFEFLTQWITIGEDARARVERDLGNAPPEVRRCALEQAGILTSLNNLMTFPWIREAITAGQIALHGWYFDMVNGQLLVYDFTSGSFKNISQNTKGFSKSKKNPGSMPEWSLDKLLKSYSKV